MSTALGVLRLSASLVASLAVLAFGASTVAAQEAAVCTKWSDRLTSQSGDYHLGNGNASVIGPESNDRIFGEGGKDLVNGGRGNDVVKGGPGNDILCGGRGDDVIHGGPGNDRIFGEEENDRIFPGPGDDKALGSADDDKLYGFGGKPGSIVDDGIDVLDGGFNDDVIIAGGADTLLGFTHDDILRTKTPDVAPRRMDGGGNNDRIFGSDADDDLRGGDNGADKLYGAGGRDRLKGGSGVDVCNGGADRDRAVGCEKKRSIPRLLPRFQFLARGQSRPSAARAAPRPVRTAPSM
jgi:Ca2+-binding RTX toxin-like protein